MTINQVKIELPCKFSCNASKKSKNPSTTKATRLLRVLDYNAIKSEQMKLLQLFISAFCLILRLLSDIFDIFDICELI